MNRIASRTAQPPKFSNPDQIRWKVFQDNQYLGEYGFFGLRYLAGLPDTIEAAKLPKRGGVKVKNSVVCWARVD